LTDFTKDKKEVEFRLFPRMLALAEVAWTELENKNYKDFTERWKCISKLFDEF